jgi:uncharacterized membrane protein (DUF4010 family)
VATAANGRFKDPDADVAVQLAASLCIGMLVGIEREWANKDFGLRSFAFVSVLGMLSAHLPIALACVAVLLVFVAGYLVGIGHVFTPVASAIVIPNRFVDPWQLINPRDAWVIVIVIAGIGLVNYVLLKLYGTRGIYLSGFLGGLVNSTAAAAELAKPLGAGTTSSTVAVAALLLTIVAKFVRNLVILAIFSPSAVGTAIGPLLAMTLGALILVRRSRQPSGATPSEIHLQSPPSLAHVLNFAASLF